MDHQAGKVPGGKSQVTRDTVRFPVKVKPMRCTFDLCTYNATDHWSGTQEELLFVLEEHASTDHPLPTAELVNGYVTRRAWNTFRDWWSGYADTLTYREQVYGSKKDIRDYLSTFVGEAGGLVLRHMGLDKFMVLTGSQMLKETERIAVKGETVDNDKRPFELPSGCNTPHFKSHELVVTKGAHFRKRLGEQKQQFAFTERELVRLLWRASKPHPKIQHQLREANYNKPALDSGRHRSGLVEDTKISAEGRKLSATREGGNSKISSERAGSKISSGERCSKISSEGTCSKGSSEGKCSRMSAEGRYSKAPRKEGCSANSVKVVLSYPTALCAALTICMAVLCMSEDKAGPHPVGHG